MQIASGGRYDYLARQIGSKKDVPAVGISIGVDRIIASDWYKKLSPRILKKPKIYFIQLGSEAKLKSLNVIEILRKAHIPIAQSLSKDSLGSQLAIAEKLSIPYTLIFGVKEALENSVIVRNMSNRSQETVKLDKLLEYLKKIIKGGKLSPNVSLEFSKDYPLKVQYDVKDKLQLGFVLAPRVSTED